MTKSFRILIDRMSPQAREKVAEKTKQLIQEEIKKGGNMRFNDDQGQPVTGFEFAALSILHTLLMIPNNLIGIIMFTLIGALGGWLLGRTPLGAWIAGGLRLFHIEAQAGDIYKLGALLGFVKSFVPVRAKEDKGKSYKMTG